MRVAILFSGGKDSTYTTWVALSQGWEAYALVTMLPESKTSYMFHHPNISFTPLQAESMGLPQIIYGTSGEKESELVDLRDALGDLKVDGVVSGAVASEYQKQKVDLICEELGLKSFAPLWHKEQGALLEEMLQAGFEIMVTSVSAEGLGESWLGRVIDNFCVEELKRLNKKFGISIAGEGGEFETFVLNSPLFKKRIKVVKSIKHWKGTGGFLEITKAGYAF